MGGQGKLCPDTRCKNCVQILTGTVCRVMIIKIKGQYCFIHSRVWEAGVISGVVVYEIKKYTESRGRT